MLPGFRVLAVSEHAGELEQAVETDASEGWCPGCGTRARLHDRRPSWVRDLPAGGRPVTFTDSDIRAGIPRFSADNRKANQALVDLLGTIAAGNGTTPVG